MAAAALVLWVQRSKRAKKRTLQEGIKDFYDASSGVWVEIWGEHMHHGYYPPGFRGNLQEHKKAQVTMIEESLKWAGVPEKGEPGSPQTFLDVGCGVGGSSRHLQRKYGGTTVGITLSPWQRNKAQQLSEAAGQGDVCSFKVADALKMPFPDNSFDLVWSMESGEHMPNKQTFMSELHRVCKPGGRILLVTWVHRNLQAGESLKPSEERLLDRIGEAYHLPPWCSINDYAAIAQEKLGMVGIRTDDWTDYIKPFWGAVIRTAIQPRGWWALARGGWSTLQGALVMPLMARGYNTGTIKFGLLTAQKATTATANAQPPSEVAAALFSQRVTRSSSSSSAPSWGVGGAGRGGRQRPQRRGGARTDDGALAPILTLWDFSRPHTLLGTLISVPAVHLFAAAPLLASLGPNRVLPALVASVLSALPAALLVNVYITGLNQIYDVDIDKINKPFLPIAAGRLSGNQAWAVCLACLALATAWALWNPFCPASAHSWALHVTLAGSAILGTAYSAPPIRMKRSPFLAAFCIIVVRGLLVNLGFYYFALEALRPFAAAVPGADWRGGLAATFFAVFGLVIALMKDVPDVLGDELNKVRSLSVRIGPKNVLNAATFVLLSLLGGTAALFTVGSVNAALVGAIQLATQRGLLAIAGFLAWRFAVSGRRGVDAHNPQMVYDFYMDVWRVFYLSYLCLPLAR